MVRIELDEHIGMPPESVWAELERIEDHIEWMAEAASIEFLGDQRRGAGTRIKVVTRVGPLHTTDVLEFTEWEPPRLMGVTHNGAVSGHGVITLTLDGYGTHVGWVEELRFPWWFGGAIGAWLARPILRRVWRGNLKRLKARVEASSE